MKKHLKLMMMAVALLTAGVLTTGCTNDDDANASATELTGKGAMRFTAKINAKGGDTRSVDETGQAAWMVDEEMAVYYEKEDGTYGTATARVDEVVAGMATISASLEDAKDGGVVKFVYPASLVNATGDDIDMTKFTAQHGTIADISAHFDAAKATATLKTNGSTYGTTTNIAFRNEVLIGKFTPKFNGTAIDEITQLTINDGTNTYTIAPTAGKFGTEGIYVAMLPVDNQEVIIMAQTDAQTYGYGGRRITLERGKMYNNLALPMIKAHDLSAAAFTANEDAFIYQTNATATANPITIGEAKKVVLSNVNIRAAGTYGTNAIICSGNADIVLSGTNTILNTCDYNRTNDKAAIKAGGTSTTLTISGCGALNVTTQTPNSKTFGAAIGSDLESTCGNITIKDGTIVATIDESFADKGQSAAIGAGGAFAKGKTSQCGTITIEGGNVTASSSYYGAAIGSGGVAQTGSRSICGDIIITGGTVTAYSRIFGAAIGTGLGQSDAPSTCGNIHISGGTVNASVHETGRGAAIGCGFIGTCSSITIDGTANVTADAFAYALPEATICGAGIGGSAGSSYGDITIGGAANVFARGSYTNSTGGGGAGIGSGSGITPSKTYAQGSYGNITINTTGTVTAIGGKNSAGIGAGEGYACGTITILNGIIDATRNTDDAYDIGKSKGGSTGTVTIDAGVQTSDGKHYTQGDASNGFNKE